MARKSQRLRRQRRIERLRAQEQEAKITKVVEDNSEYVGDDFAEKARAIHYGETIKRNIYGEATEKEVQELDEEGVDFARLPKLPRSTRRKN